MNGLISVLLAVLPLSGFQETDVSRPDPEGTPTTVYVQLAILDVDEIDSSAQNFTANTFFRLRWSDPRLAYEGSGPRLLPLNDVWNPALVIVNRQKLFPALPEQVAVQPDGMVTYSQGMWGDYSQPLDLRDFPFDRQTFQFVFASAVYGETELQFLQDPTGPSGLAPSFSVPDWETENFQAGPQKYSPLEGGRGVAGFVAQFEGQRYHEYYLVHFILPLLAIVLASWVVYWLELGDGSRISIGMTSILTLIAYRFMINGMLPRISYKTRLDDFVFACTLIVFATLGVSVAVNHLSKRDRGPFARKINGAARILVPVGLVASAMASLMV